MVSTDDYVATLTDEQIVALVRLGAALRAVIRRKADLDGRSTLAQRKAFALKAKRAGWAHLASLLAITEARRPKLSSMRAWAAKIDVPVEVIDDIAARFPAGLAPE